MQRKSLFWFAVSLMCLGGAAYFWHLGDEWQARKDAARSAANPSATAVAPPQAKTTPHAFAHAGTNQLAPVTATSTNPYPYRLANTDQSLNQLIHNDKAILLANALIDTTKPLPPGIPDRLRSAANGGSYVVQARGALTPEFRAALRDANATIISYIPNNAYLVRVSDSGAQDLSANAKLTQSVVPCEPYYKLDESLLKLAMEQPAEVPPNGLRVTVFPDAYQTTVSALQQMGAIVLGEDRSPFGPVLNVEPAEGTLSAVASLPGVQLVSALHKHAHANDLLRPSLGGATNSLTQTNYLNLTGSNVLVNINDDGVDQTHPELTNRLTADFAGNLIDFSGHGTHVAGTILGSGLESTTVSPVPQGSDTNSGATAGPLVFRGMATNAMGFVMSFNSPDSYLQENAARTNAFISNNSWNYTGDAGYDIAAASYDAAVRDALPEVPGSQPVLFVFSAGNSGRGTDGGTGGATDTILSPATAKNVITVGAVEQFRQLTNLAFATGDTNGTEIFLPSTDSSNQIASFSSRGNVGVSVEGTSGRFKPDLVAPGTFVISDRSQEWDTGAYYNPTNETDTLLPNRNVTTNALNFLPPLFVEGNDVQIVITILTNRLSPVPFPPLPIYASLNNTNSLVVVGTNTTSAPQDGVALTPFETIYFAIGNLTNPPVNFDVTIQVFQTNDTGIFTALSNLNNSLNTSSNGPDYYRYESGTSMAAAGVSGMLADMQEFFQARSNFLTFSPALMKALLINGANPLQNYDLQVNTGLNSQGWGMPSLTNSLPIVMTNITAGNRDTMPVIFRDQSPTRVLATGQSNAWNLALNPTGNAPNQDLRITLVWTDPPGNPAAGTKLVNDLDLIVSNNITGDIIYGNDIPAGTIYNELGDTNAPTIDSVNNVENVFLQQPVDTNYTIMVLARRVNVNAVTANTSDIVQDYALVISSVANPNQQGETSPFVSLTPALPNTAAIPLANDVTNLIVVTNGVPLFNQRVGANSQYAGSTNGEGVQWNFYIYTNTAFMTNADFTNVAFITFAPPELGVPRMEASGEIGPFDSPIPGFAVADNGATRFAGSDVDLYVSADPNLTNLTQAAVDGALKSTSRTGTEKVLITDAPASNPSQVYYIAIKSEAQQGAQYDFLAVATDLPFDQRDQDGNTIVTILTPFPAVIPPGGPENPEHALILGVSTSPITVRKAVVTNEVAHQEFGDLIGTLTHESAKPVAVVLNNHSFYTNLNLLTNEFVYDDSGENEFPGAKTSDGPGTLRDFTGDKAADGIWRFVMVNDSSLTDTGAVVNFVIKLEPQPPPGGFQTTIQPDSFFYDFVDVPPDATNLTISISQNTAPLDLYLRYGDFPTQGIFDYFTIVPVGGTNLTVSKFSNPPLNAGRYFFGIFNPGTTAESVFVSIQIGVSLSPAGPATFTSRGDEPLLDDAVTYSTNHVAANSFVVDAEVGVRIEHPRESDLVLTLVSPEGTRVLLAENRGGLDTNGYGSGLNVTNVLPQSSNGGPSGNTNLIDLTNTMGTLIVNFDFHALPDDMRVYYQGVLLYDTGTVANQGSFSVDFGPGTSTNIEIVMDGPGSGFSTNVTDKWDYTATVVTKDITYAIFSENTNLATIPIKFAPPPFGGGSVPFLPATNVLMSSFEGIPAGNYFPGSAVDGWTVFSNGLPVNGTNEVTVVTVPQFADNTNIVGVQNTNVLALHSGAITRVLPTVPGRSYSLIFANHGRPVLSPVSWYRAENNGLDTASGNDGFLESGVGFANGEVGQSFTFNGSNQWVQVPNTQTLNFSNRLTAEAWINPADFSQFHSIITKWDGVAMSQLSYALSLDTGGHAYFIVSSTGRENAAATTFGSVTTLGTLPANQWTHVAGTYDGIAVNIFVNGILQGSTSYNQGIFVGSDPLAIGANGGGENADLSAGGGMGIPSPFKGLIDEATVYSNALSARQIQDIYAAGSAGKCPLNGGCVVSATVLLGQEVKTITGIDEWTTNFYTFTAPSNSMVLTIIPNTNLDGTVQDGMLVDSFQLIQNATPNPTNYYLPEESLDKLVGERAQGDWKLEVLDNRAGATNPPPVLVSWQLSLTLADRIPFSIPLQHAIPQTNEVQPNSITYFQVTVPVWAQFATNFLTVLSGPAANVNLLFSQTAPPTGTNFGDLTLFNSGSLNVSTLSSSTTPPLVPGETYYLGVQNLNATSPAFFTIEVDFDITTLTNGIPVTSPILTGGVPRYFQFDVLTNSVVALFQILNPSGSVEMVVQKGPPLPDTQNFDYAMNGSSNQTVTLLTNSTPVALAAGRWYAGVFNSDTVNVNYTIVARQAGPPTIISLTNDVPLQFNSGPGPALTNFFVFAITNTNSAALFELCGLSGNVDLTLQRGALPYGPPFFDFSGNGGKTNEQIVIRTNILSTNINDNWYLGVPNNTGGIVTYTVHAVVSTNGLLVSKVPIMPVITLPPPGSPVGPTLTTPTVQGEMYELESCPTPFFFPGTVTILDTFTAGGDISTVTDPNPVPMSGGLFYRIVQIPSP